MDNETLDLMARLPDDTALALSPGIFNTIRARKESVKPKDSMALRLAEAIADTFHRSHAVWIQKKTLQEMLKTKPEYSVTRFADMFGRGGWNVLVYARIPDRAPTPPPVIQPDINPAMEGSPPAS